MHCPPIAQWAKTDPKSQLILRRWFRNMNQDFSYVKFAQESIGAGFIDGRPRQGAHLAQNSLKKRLFTEYSSI